MAWYYLGFAPLLSVRVVREENGTTGERQRWTQRLEFACGGRERETDQYRFLMKSVFVPHSTRQAWTSTLPTSPSIKNLICAVRLLKECFAGVHACAPVCALLIIAPIFCSVTPDFLLPSYLKDTANYYSSERLLIPIKMCVAFAQ